MLLFVLGIMDIIIAGVLWISSGTPFPGNGIVMLLGIAWLLKGLYSVLTAAAGKFFFDVLGILDLFCGLFLILSFYGLSWHFFFYAAFLLLLKGLYCAGTDFVTTFLRGA